MKKKILKYTLWVFLLALGIGMFAMNTEYLNISVSLPEPEPVMPQDTVTRYPVAKTAPEEYEDIQQRSPADLRNPDNVKTSVEYDIRTGVYVIRTRIGEMEINTPIMLTPEEYQDYSMQQSLRSYFRRKNEEEFQKEAENQFNLTDMQFGLGPAERIFGPGGVRVRTQGSAEIKLGLKNNTTKDPTLPERARSRTFFNFDESVQLNVQANVGSKVNFDMNYNTETSFDFDSKKLKLAYQGEEDEIIKNIEAGNVSMTTNNSLIRGGAALFGMKADLQFGKLRVNTLFAQQESESKTVNSKGGVQTKPFELPIDQYDENRHFFLAHYFYYTYDEALKRLPYIASSVVINRLEVWVTNKRGKFDQARNIVAFADLAENATDDIYNDDLVQPSGSQKIPYNEANTLYRLLTGTYAGARDISKVTSTLGSVMEGGKEYEKIENARLLETSEYTYNKQLGYISLRSPLQADEVLAVAFEYEYNGTTYQVGELSTDKIDNTGGTGTGGDNISSSLYVKLLKGATQSPDMPFWKLMMKNVYSLNAYSIQKEKFRLDILFQSDTTGTYVNYIPEGAIQNELLLRVMNLDRLDSKNETNPDGFYDYVEGITVNSENGRIIFPVVEPFGSHLENMIGSKAIADKYTFHELYDSTLTVARQIAEKNKFIFRGEYKASSGAEIQLGATNVARGSVQVTAGGATLTENVDYTVDYTSGTVTILNESIISSNTPVSVSLENQSMYSMQRKTMMGLDLNYQFTRDFSLGATIMHMSEMPLTVKTTMGDESIKNTLWGLNTSYKGESQWLTNVFDKLPLLTLTKPSQIAFNAEFAHLIAGHYENKQTGGYSYLDDFESTQSGFNLLNPYSWQLASTPYQDGANALFPEANLVNDIRYGMNRALLAWYYIDGMFTRKNSSVRFPGINKDSLSNHYVRAVEVSELFPGRQTGMSDASVLPVLNLAYYPNERGPYNLDAENINSDGTLGNPEKRWGGMMRRIEQSDFETANIEYIEFWMLDPFINNPTADGGDLYFNLGEVSEDILKDEKKFYENGLPVNPNTETDKFETTVWGRVPTQPSTVYAFDNAAGARRAQDVGLNGLHTDDEKEFETYVNYVERYGSLLSTEAANRLREDPFSPFNDPAGDNYRYFRDDYYDQIEAGILERYKRYNGTEGNSEESTGRYDTSAKTTPDVEDLNQDNTLNENEKYFEYKVSLRPEDLKVGMNHIVDIREANPLLANDTREKVNWYLFRVPIREYDRSVGSIRDFKTIRFMRVFMTGFSEPVVVRMGTFQLVRGEWRTYTQDLSNPNMPAPAKASLVVASVNIEENGEYQTNGQKPLNYVLPPGITRVLDPSQPQLRQENEQSLSLTVNQLYPQDAVAIYKTTYYDLRQYKRMQLFTHLHALIADNTDLKNGELSVFLRLGSDYKNNYYEYEVPLAVTDPRKYGDSDAERLLVWPTENKLDFKLERLTNAKLNRNRKRREGNHGVDYHIVYSENDEDNPRNRISVIGNPSLSEVKTIMIGIRNNSAEVKSGEVWVNELRLTDFNEEGGWAANANLTVALSDLGTVNASGRIETSGFGSLDQSLMERRMEDYSQYSISTNVQLGKFFPEKAQVNLPFYYAYSRETTDPKYNPLDQDIKLKDALDVLETQAEKDSLNRYSQDVATVRSIAFNNVNVNIRSKNPMPYDPANFSLSYAFSESNMRNPETEYETQKDYQGSFAYRYTPYAKPWQPFGKIKKNNGYTKYFRQLAINYLPSSIEFQTTMVRNYYEIQLRDLTGTSGGNTDNLLSFSQNFLWDRAFSLRWNLTNTLNFSFNSGTNARIEEPHVQVNKELNPNQYQVWKDSVKQSIRELGTPLKYDQNFQVTWNMPLQSIPVLDWVNSSLKYSATYVWERGALSNVEDIDIGNTIRNQRQFSWDGNFNLQGLYNKSPFLKRVNQKFTPNQRTNTTNTRNQQQQQQKKEPKKPVKVEMDIQLNPDSGTIVDHKLLNNKITIRAKRLDGKTYPIKYKAINFSQAMILTKDTVALKIVVTPGAKPTFQSSMINVAEYSSRMLMMLRRISVRYNLTDGMMIPGFSPEIGSMLGQTRQGGIFAPGLGFAFGDVRRSYITEANDRGWLIKDENNITPAMMNRTELVDINATLEPFKGLKIDLRGNWTNTRSTEIKYMYEGMPEVQGGTFTMTTIALSSAFKSGNADNGYESEPFRKFLENREIIAQRLEERYAGTNYPSGGFMEGSAHAGQPYDPATGEVNRNSADVLIPAFLAAYTGKNAGSIGFSPFPALSSMLPNWTITYDGLSQLPFFKKYFKSFVLNHMYRSTYSVGSFSTYTNWLEAEDGLGYIRNVQNGNPLPSSAYDISSVGLIESFNPLLGANATLLNNMTTKLMFNKERTLNLNISSYQLVEGTKNEIIVGIGYRITEFNKVLKRKASQNFSNDLNVTVDFSYRKNHTLIRKIDNSPAQATAGQITKTIMFSADYGISRALTLRAFYDLQINEPLLSSSYPTSNSNYGISLRFSLAQ